PIRRSSGTRRRHLSEREGNRESKGEADTPPSLRKRNLTWLRPVNPDVSAGLVGAALGPVDCGYGGYGCRNWQCHRATRQQLTRCFLSTANAAGFVSRDRGGRECLLARGQDLFKGIREGFQSYIRSLAISSRQVK